MATPQLPMEIHWDWFRGTKKQPHGTAIELQYFAESKIDKSSDAMKQVNQSIGHRIEIKTSNLVKKVVRDSNLERVSSGDQTTNRQEQIRRNVSAEKETHHSKGLWHEIERE